MHSLPSSSDRSVGDRTARWVLTTCTASLVMIVLATTVILQPLTSARADVHRVAAVGVPAETELDALRTTVIHLETYFDSRLVTTSPGAPLSSTDLVIGIRLVQEQALQATTLEQLLRHAGLVSMAGELDAATRKFSIATNALAPIAIGRVVPTAVRARLAATADTALDKLLTTATSIHSYLSKNVIDIESLAAARHLRRARTFLLFAAGLGLLFALIVGSAIGLRARREERARRSDARQRVHELRLQTALNMTVDEESVYEILGESLGQSLPRLEVEMLVADSRRARFRRTLTSSGAFGGCAAESPGNCPAVTAGQTLSFATSSALDACPHLKHRESGVCSAACIPVSMAGRTVGVVHVVGPDATPPSERELATLNFTSRRGTERISMLRAFDASAHQTRNDPLAGLVNCGTVQHRVREFDAAAVPYTLGHGRIDEFRVLTDTHGAEAGDQALRLFARVLRDAARPNDIVVACGGDDFLVVLPDCSTDVAVGVLERARERLALRLAAGTVPSFTATFGVASTRDAPAFEEIVALADEALADGQVAGRNRVVVATLAEPRHQAAGHS